METNYKVTIKEASRELTAKEKIALKDLGNAVSLDSVLNENDSFIINPADYVLLEVHNEKAKGDKDYTKFVVIDTAGTKYTTGSNSFVTKFMEIYDTMKEEAPDEDYQIEVYKRPSKNYSGKSFISCSLI